MTEEEWMSCRDSQRMLDFLRERLGDKTLIYDERLCRVVRLFACACCRRIWHLRKTEVDRRAVEVAERYADREVGSLSLLRTGLASLFHSLQAPEHEVGCPAGLILFTRSLPLTDAAGCAWNAALAVSRAIPDAAENARNAETSAQAALVRDLFGNPFRPPPTLDPGVLQWDEGTVVRLAQTAYDNRTMPAGTLDPARLAVLADALEEAGCEDAEILGHLRGPGPHVRGCQVVDLLLDKK
jgi:hypothetical protein